MKTTLITAIIALLFLTVQVAETQAKALLRLHLQKGESYQLTITSDNKIDQQMMGQQMKVQQKMELGSVYKVLDVLADQNYVIEYSMNKMKMDMDVNGQKVTVDSDGAANDPASQSMKEMTSMKLKFTMTSMGKIQSIEGLEEYMNKVNGNQQLTQALSMFANVENFKTSFGQYFGYFPEAEVEVGTKWDIPIKLTSLMNMDMTIHYTVNEITADQVVLGLNSEVNMDSPIENNGMKIQMKATGTQTGIMKTDLKTGLVGTQDINQKFDMNMKLKNPQSGEDMEIPITMDAVTKVKITKL